MGNTDTKLNFRKAVVELTTKTQPVEANDQGFWEQFWTDSGIQCVQDVFALVPAAEIRALREESPSNLATLCYKAVEKLIAASESGCRTMKEQQTVLNCIRLLTRILPYIFEDADWRGFFWSTLPGQDEDIENNSPQPLAQSLLNALTDLLFCPDFTVTSSTKRGQPESPEEIGSIDSCEYIWEAGVGFAISPPHNATHDNNRTEIIKLILTTFSETMYIPAIVDIHQTQNQWISYLTSTENRHALPLFTSILNIICSYDPVGFGVPYNHLMFNDSREPLVETALQLLCVTLDNPSDQTNVSQDTETIGPDNLFINYLSRIHREEDFSFILKGITKLLNNPLLQTYLPGSCKRVQFHQELFVLFWRMCDINKKFMFYVLKSSDVLDILVPILYHLNESRADQSKVGLMHIAVFILLLLSGERNFGVRLNKPYSIRVPMDIPVFTGTHADFLIIVFHKIITTGHQRLQPLFDCLLTIIVNVSPYLKTLSMVAANKLLHLLEAFSTPWFLYASPTNHHLVFFLLEIFNNIIQYQFDGNSNLVYTIIRKRNVFHQLANLPIDHLNISKALSKRNKKVIPGNVSNDVQQSMDGSKPATDAQPGTLKATLAATPEVSDGSSICEPVYKTKLEIQHYTNRKSNLMDSKLVSNLFAIDNMTEKAPPMDSSENDENLQDAIIDSDQPNTEYKVSESENSAPSSSHETPEHSAKLPTNDVIKETKTQTTETAPIPTIAPLPEIAESHCIQTWVPTSDWVQSWKQKLPLQTIMRLLQVLVPQVEKICIDKGLTDESEILRFLQHGTLVGLLPVPHPILIRKYQANSGTTMWFRTYMWGVIYLRNVDPPIWYDTDVKLFEIQRV